MAITSCSTPRAPRQTLVLFALACIAAAINGIAALTYTPSTHLQQLGRDVTDSRVGPAVIGTPLDLVAAVLFLVLGWGLLRRRPMAWAGAVLLFASLAGTDFLRHEPPLEIVFPAIAVVSLLVMRRQLVAEPYRDLLRRQMIPTDEALTKTSELVRRYGTDTLAPFKRRADVGHLFSTRGDAVLAFRVENRALLVAADPVGTPEGVDEVLRAARDLARGAGLRFGVTAASEGLAAHLRERMAMHSLYMGCEAIVSVGEFTLEGRKIKKVRQAHRRVLREGYDLTGTPFSSLTRAELAELRRCELASRGDDHEQSFSMAPDALTAPALRDAIVYRATESATGRVAGVVVFSPLQQRSLWSLALQLRDPVAPNGVIDALLVHALQDAKAQGVEELSLNFAAARRYLHEPVSGVWPRVARSLARLAMRWTQIDDLRFHNEKFSPRWEQRFLVTDHVLQVPHLAFAAIWQEGQLPRPSAFIAPAWPQASPDVGAPARA